MSVAVNKMKLTVNVTAVNVVWSRHSVFDMLLKCCILLTWNQQLAYCHFVCRILVLWCLKIQKLYRKSWNRRYCKYKLAVYAVLTLEGSTSHIQSCRTHQSISWRGGTAAAAPPPFRPSDPALCGSRPLVTPYYCRLGDLLCLFCVYRCVCALFLCISVFSCFRCFVSLL